MAEPGTPPMPAKTPVETPHDHDDLVGFSSPASLAGRSRETETVPEFMSATPNQPVKTSRQSEPDLFDPRPSAAFAAVQAETTLAPVAAPASAGSIFEPAELSTKSRQHDDLMTLPKDGANLFLGYALILFAVPTLGVSVVVGLLAVMRRGVPEDTLSRSHHLYQRRTLFAAAVTAVVGLVLIAAPFALGVPVLFLLAIWIILRGASGVMTLKAGRPIRHPLGWWI